MWSRHILAQRSARGQIARDGKKLEGGLGAAAAGIILGGVLTRDGLFALTAGMSGFDGALQGALVKCCGNSFQHVFG
jgi:hypothetical protein